MKDLFVFDIDGVITHPSRKINTEPEILNHIIEKLKINDPVALNTGRSLAWIKERVINLLLAKIQNKAILKNLIAMGEMGGIWLTFDNNGQANEYIDNSLSIPKPLMEKIKELIKEKYSKSMFYDDTKKTMVSIEMNEGMSIDVYKKIQKLLMDDLHQIIKMSSLGKNLKIDTTTIAADVMNKHVGKGFAVHRIVDWLKEKKINLKQIFAFGDSMSDLPMAEKFYELGFLIEFVSVGNQQIQQSEYKFPIIYTTYKFEKGTLEFLASNSSEKTY